MNDKLMQEDNEAFFSRNDRFDGFDRGDVDNEMTDAEIAEAMSGEAA